MDFRRPPHVLADRVKATLQYLENVSLHFDDTLATSEFHSVAKGIAVKFGGHTYLSVQIGLGLQASESYVLAKEAGRAIPSFIVGRG